ncbi:MAG: tRNA (N(6)-L-threonylcarbamoyladenosine(37)-C(2))-methylthiotransferase MtaB [Beijerinckiaceae bacterium]|nr:tRNA (N(6)-L-threonylcarbamoyladenosine(37)-C(2))-methylthiotransferase MtaB [Beijerinckiaceae bacterium]
MTTSGKPARAVEVVTFGCRLNAVESEAVRRAAEEAQPGQTIVFNTCAVTQEAVRQARQAIRRAGREHPEARIVVTGCAAQIDPHSFAAMPEVAAVMGNADKAKPAAWDVFARDGAAIVNDIFALPETAHHFVAGAVDSIEGHTRAFVEVQNGCDHRCTFCIIPFGRGPSRSAPAGDVVAQIRKLVANGYREAVLTGVDLTSWGHDLPGQPSLGRLVKQILKLVPELERLRLSSIDCIEADEALIEAFSNEPRLMPHLHLSLQSGDDMILKRMKRRHSRDEAIAICARLRAARPDIVFGADLIAGFPTETEDMFARTLALADDCGLTHLHVFPFSPRTGTPAARMPQLARHVVKARAAALREKSGQRLRKHLDAQIGRTLTLLAERGGIGRAEDFTPAKIVGAEPGRMIRITICGHDGERLF